MIRRPPRSTLDRSSAASDVYKRQENPFGYKGRTSILEELTIGEEIRALLGAEILPTSQQLEEAAKRGGMITMYQAGLLKCLSGETTLEEINRVM